MSESTNSSAENHSSETGKPWNRRFASLRVRLLLLVILASVPGLIMTVYSAAEQRQNAEEEVRQTALRLARLATSNQDQLVEGARQLLVALAALPAVQHQDSRSCNSFLESLLQQYPLYANIWAVDALEEPGNIYCSGIPFSEQVNVGDAPYYRQTLEAGDFTGGEYAREPIAGSAVLPFGYPVPPGFETPHAVVVAGLDLNWLSGFVAQAGLPPDSSLSVIDRNGRILVRYPNHEDLAGSSIGEDALRPLLAESEGVVKGVGTDGVPRVYAFKVLCCLTSGDIYVRVGIPKEAAFAESNRLLRRNLTALGGVSLFALLAAWFGGNVAVVREMQRLVRTTQRLAAGDFSARTGLAQYGGEFGQLADSLDQMAGALEVREADRQQAEAALRQHSERTEALVRAAGRLNAQLDLASVLTTVCDETASALGANAAAVGLYDPPSDAFVCATTCGLSDDFRHRVSPLPRAVLDSMVGANGLFQTQDMREAAAFREAAEYVQAGIRSLASATMTHEGVLVGYLALFTARMLTSHELAMLRGLADQAALAISNARLYEALGQEQHLCAGLLERVISAQEEERKRIARELHDDTSQGLTASILSLDAAQMALRAHSPKAEEHVGTGKGIVERVLDSTQRLMRDLRPALLDDLGLVPAIVSHAEERLKPQGIAFSIQGEGARGRLPPVMETALFRIAQEAMTNIVKHSAASEVAITLRVTDRNVLLVVKDNGIGFDPSSFHPTKEGGRGLGLRGMQERAAILGGKCRIESAAGRGTAVVVDVPNGKVGGENGQDTGASGGRSRAHV